MNSDFDLVINGSPDVNKVVTVPKFGVGIGNKGSGGWTTNKN